MKKIVSFFADHSETFDQLNRQAADHARALGYDYRWEPQSPFQADQVIAALKEADVGIIDVEPYGEEIFKEIQGHTKLLVRFGVGFDKVDLAAASRHGIAIARTTAANASGVAEMALSLILAARRGLRHNRIHCIDTGKWDRYVYHETAGATVGILGLGAIGRILARLCLGLGCRVMAYDPYASQDAAQALGVELVDLDKLFTTADAISVIFELVRAINIAVEKNPTKALATACLDMLHEFTDVLGLLYNKKEEDDSLDSKVEAMIEARQAARKAKNFAEADRIRDELKAMGITLMDTPQGVKWSKD